jgi:DNA modification methylase
MTALRWKIATGDALTVLRAIHDRARASGAGPEIHCCVTSPPYFGLRDYKIDPTVWGGAAPCAHVWGRELPGKTSSPQMGLAYTGNGAPETRLPRLAAAQEMTTTGGNFCTSCGAWRGQLGLEPTPQLYVEHLVEVFRAVRAVLRDDGVLWLNLGDSYARDDDSGLKPKDLIGIPWRVAFALQTDGWYLRMDVVWEKGNPMPESVTDRPTKSHEYIFLLAKSERYYYDRYAILEPFTDSRMWRDGGKKASQRNRGGRADGLTKPSGIDPSLNGGRNRRSVWRINGKPFKGAHFAVFPPELPALCIAAGSSEKCCGKCGVPYERVIDKTLPVITAGWTPTCTCGVALTTPAVILDPFCGSGTTGEVALGLGREFFGIELNPAYVAMGEGRIRAALAAPAPPALADTVRCHGSAAEENGLASPDPTPLSGGVLPGPDIGVVGRVEDGANGSTVAGGQGSSVGIDLGNHPAGSGHAAPPAQSLPPQSGDVK